MTTLTGTVTSKSRNGTGIQLNGDKSTWYNGSTDQLREVEWKSEVSMEVDDRNKIISISAATAAKPAANQKAANSYQSTENKRQEVIVFQSARNAAIDFINNMVTAGVVKLPAKQADMYAAYTALVAEHTVSFYEQAMTVYEGDAARDVLGVE